MAWLLSGREAPSFALCLELAAVSGACGGSDLLSLSEACRNAVPALAWQRLLWLELGPVEALVRGTACELGLREGGGPAAKRYYFHVHRGWKREAQARSGRLLVQVGTQAPSGRGRHECCSLSSLWSEWQSPGPRTYGVYDVTAFVHEHPGPALLEDLCKLHDATEWFSMAAHSDHALQKLQTLHVPGLERLPYRQRGRAPRTRGARGRTWWRALSGVGSRSFAVLALALACCAWRVPVSKWSN